MDKKARDIIGLPVVTFERGSKIYDVEDLIVDPERRQVLALVVEEKSAFHSAKAIPFGRITAIGPDAVIVPDGRAVIAVDRDPVLRRLYNNHTVRGLRVLTDDGRKLGQIDDMLIDDKTGEVKGYHVSTGAVLNVAQGTRWLPIDSVLNMGARVMYVPGSVADDFEQQKGGLAGALEQAGDQMGAAVSRGDGNMPVGRLARETVLDDGGNIIILSGDMITQAHVQAAKNANKLPQLMKSAGVGSTQQNLGALGEQAGQGISDMRHEARNLWARLTDNYTRTIDQAEDRLMQQRIKHALGRPASRVILDPNDNIILNTGDIITNRAVQAARATGVLDILVASVYSERPKLSVDELKAPRTGDASLENTVPGSTPSPAPDLGRDSPDEARTMELPEAARSERAPVEAGMETADTDFPGSTEGTSASNASFTEATDEADAEEDASTGDNRK